MSMTDRAGRNRTLTLTEDERTLLRRKIVPVASLPGSVVPVNTVIHGDSFQALTRIPPHSVDLALIDPPYNLNKQFNTTHFAAMEIHEYAKWVDRWFRQILPTLTEHASVYVCGDWRSSSAIFEVMSQYLYVHNRITWEREKGRGARRNWKNTSEDIWFGSRSKTYVFNVDPVKIKRRVLAPYRDARGEPKDWEEDPNGNFRLTHPSNVWTDLTVPFWSMPENTDHPTQKPEKLVAKIILASSRPGDVVLDPFLGSGTTAVVAKKLGRKFYAIELEDEYCCLAQKRLELAETDSAIQGYHDGVFWERNTLSAHDKVNPALSSQRNLAENPSCQTNPPTFRDDGSRTNTPH